MQNVLSLIKGFLYEMGGQLAPEAFVEEDLIHLPSAEPRTVSGDFYEIPDGPARPMGIQLFQTGQSHTYLIGTIQTEGDVRPVHYSSVVSAILHRTNGRFTPYSRPIVTNLIILDLTGIKDDEVIERYGDSIEIIDIGHDSPNYNDRRISAIRQSARVRHEMQEEGLLALEDLKDTGVLVAIDGTLAGIDEAKKLPGLIGLVPATPDILGDNNSVLNLPFYARTAIDMSEEPAIFYMRLRDSSGRNPDFGLVRVEMTNQADGEPADEAWASDIASLIMQERFPVKKTIPGWDKRIYALYHAGEYINTLIPPPKVVTTYFGRSSA